MNVTSTPATKSAIKVAFVNPSTTGNTAVVAAPTGMQIRVLAVALTTTLANTVKFQSNTTDITASFPLAANGTIVLPYNDHGWFNTAVGEALNVNLSVATATGVHITYIITGDRSA